MTQAEVTETNPEPTQATGEAENAQDEVSLDSLLSQYDETPKEEPKQEPPKEAPISAEIQSFMERQMAKETNQVLSDAAKMLRDAVGETNLSEEWFEGQLYRAGAKDPRITEAFNRRDENPGRWESIVKGMGKDLAKTLMKTDKGATDSWNAVEASVHSSQTSAPKPEVDFSDKAIKNLSDADFMALKKKYGFSR